MLEKTYCEKIIQSFLILLLNKVKNLIKKPEKGLKIVLICTQNIH